MIRREHPRVLRSIDWHVTCQGICRSEGCALNGCFVQTTVSCNLVALPRCPVGRDSSQEMLNRLLATAESTPRPCPDCSRDMDPRGAQFKKGTPHILVIHTRRARHDGTRDRGRVEFEERVHMRGDWYRLIAVSQYANPEDEASIQGGHYTTYRRRHGGSWVLHDDMYVTGEVPVLDDPANTTAVYRKEGLLSRRLDASAWTWTVTTPGSRGSPRQSPEESTQLEGPPSTPPSRREDPRGMDTVLAGLGPVDETGGLGTPGSHKTAGRSPRGDGPEGELSGTSPSDPGRACCVDVVSADLGPVREPCHDGADSVGGMMGSTALALMEVGGTDTHPPPVGPPAWARPKSLQV